MWVDKLCVNKLCVSKLCVSKLCVSKLCVSKLCASVCPSVVFLRATTVAAIVVKRASSMYAGNSKNLGAEKAIEWTVWLTFLTTSSVR